MILKKGVTMTEILIVIGILSLLFALLFPALNPVKDTTVFEQRIRLIQDTVVEQRMKAQGGVGSANLDAVRLATGVRFKKPAETPTGEVTTITFHSTPSTNQLLENNISLTDATPSPYNLLSYDPFFSNNPDLPPVAKVEEIRTVESNGAMVNAITANTLDIVYLPNSNDTMVYRDGVPVIPTPIVEVEISSLKHPGLKKVIAISPSSGISSLKQ